MARIRSWRLQVIAGVLAAAPAIVAHLFPLKFASAGSVSLETVVVAVTSLIAGWVGGAVTLLFLTVVTFAAAETLAAPIKSCGLNVVVAALCVLGVYTVRHMMAIVRGRERLRRQLAQHRQRLDSIRAHVARLRQAVQTREQKLLGREAELAKAARPVTRPRSRSSGARATSWTPRSAPAGISSP